MKKGYILILLALVCITSFAEKRVFVKFETTKGNFVVALYNETPLHRDNFIKKVKSGIYNGRSFNRVIKDFMIQCGEEQEEDIIPAEINYPKFFHKRGVLAMGRCTSDSTHELKSADEQFFIAWGKIYNDKQLSHFDQRMQEYSYGRCSMDSIIKTYYKENPGIPWLDGSYTIFGEVVSGLNVIRKIQSTPTDKTTDKPLKEVKIIKAYIIRKMK